MQTFFLCGVCVDLTQVVSAYTEQLVYNDGAIGSFLHLMKTSLSTF